MEKVCINYCSFNDLVQIVGIGEGLAQKILDLRHATGEVTPESLSKIPYMRNLPQLMEIFDFGRYTPARGWAPSAHTPIVGPQTPPPNISPGRSTPVRTRPDGPTFPVAPPAGSDPGLHPSSSHHAAGLQSGLFPFPPPSQQTGHFSFVLIFSAKSMCDQGDRRLSRRCQQNLSELNWWNR